MINLEENKEKINSIKREIAQLQKGQEKLEDRVCDLEEKVVNLDKAHSKLETLTTSLTETIGKLDGKLDNIVEEIQRLSTQLAVNETRHSIHTNNDDMLMSLFDSKNKPLIYLIVILGTSFLFLLGVKAETIANLLGGL